MRTLKERKIEEKRLLFQSLVQSNDGDKCRAMLDFQFFERCLNIKRTHSLMPSSFAKKGARRGDYLDALENMMDLHINELKEHGYITEEVTELKLDTISHVLSEFTFTYIKQKGKSGKLRNHQDSWTVLTTDEQNAKFLLGERLKKLKENLLEIKNCQRRKRYVVTKSGEWLDIDSVEILS